MEAFKKALIEMLRVMVMAAIPVVIASLSEGSFIVNWQAVLLAAVIAGLRFVDKFLHELGKEKKSDLLTKGLVRF